MIGTPWKRFPCIEPGCTKQITVDVVPEDAIEESGLNPDLVEGDNWIHDQRQTDHKRGIPDHHIWLTDVTMKAGPVKIVKTLAHELAEVVAEAFGLPYEPAHELVANSVETQEAKAQRHRAPRLPWR